MPYVLNYAYFFLLTEKAFIYMIWAYCRPFASKVYVLFYFRLNIFRPGVKNLAIIFKL